MAHCIPSNTRYVLLLTASPVSPACCSPSLVRIVFFVLRLCRFVLCICSCDSPCLDCCPCFALYRFWSCSRVYASVWSELLRTSFWSRFVLGIAFFGGQPTFVGLVRYPVWVSLSPFHLSSVCLLVLFSDSLICSSFVLFVCFFDSLVSFDGLVHPRLGRTAVLWRISLYVSWALHSPYLEPGHSP